MVQICEMRRRLVGSKDFEVNNLPRLSYTEPVTLQLNNLAETVFFCSIRTTNSLAEYKHKGVYRPPVTDLEQHK